VRLSIQIITLDLKDQTYGLYFSFEENLLLSYITNPHFSSRYFNNINPISFLQGVLVFLAAKSGFIKNAEEAADLQNFVLCVEMLAAAVGHLYAFPYKEYAGANIGASSCFTGNLAHALKFNDFYHDTVHQASTSSLVEISI